ncbi:hypothetical protein JTB14_031930 [Gonioctena quinquepunctata]|nr:hypothetical protein JTB14_031930 [Gonioctena quinquepunctata]
MNFENGSPGEVVTSALSDHEAQILKINNTKQAEVVSNETRTKKRIFSDSKLTQLRNELHILKWATLYSYNDPNEAYDYFFGTLKQLMDVVVPLKKFKISGRKKRDWIFEHPVNIRKYYINSREMEQSQRKLTKITVGF